MANVDDDRDRARRLYRESLEAFRALGDEHSVLLVTRHLALAYADLGDVHRARALHEANVVRARETGNPRMEASALGSLAEYALDQGRTDDALALLERSLRLHRDVGDVLDTAIDLSRVAAALAAAGADHAAARLLASFDALSGDQVGLRREWVAALNQESAHTSPPHSTATDSPRRTPRVAP